MAKANEPYRYVVVESYREGGRGYPVGTKFRIKAKLTDKEEGGEFLYSYFGWKFEVLP